MATQPTAAPPEVKPQPPKIVTPRTTVKVQTVKTSGAVYRLEVDCVYDGVRQSGAKVPGPTKLQPRDAAAGLKMTYEFFYKKDQSKDPIVSSTENCKLYTTKLRQAAEPTLSVLLGCEGESEYTQDRQPPSAIAKSWHDLSALTKPFTHTMKAPKNQYQISEHVLCTISVVSR